MGLNRAVGRVINLAAGDRHTLLELYATLGELLGSTVKPEFRPARAGEIKHSEADIQRARNILGFSPTVSWREGLERTVEWFRSTMPATPTASARSKTTN
jgi:nucleoside-diphosphate-sugar epimerase